MRDSISYRNSVCPSMRMYAGFFTAPCYSNGAVLPSYGVCPSVCL